MKNPRQLAKKAMLWSAALGVLAIGGKLAAPAIAKGAASTAALIDKDWQVACVKHFEKRFFTWINASDAQQTQIDSLIAQSMDDTYSDREKLREGLVELNNSFSSADAKDEDITAKAHALRDLHQKVMDKRLDTLLKVRQTLTPEQRKQIGSRVNEFLTGTMKPRFMRGAD